MIKSIFYSRFHPEKGPTILHQVPAGLISLSGAPTATLKRESNASRGQRRSSSSPPPTKLPSNRQQTGADRPPADVEAPAKPTTLFPFSSISNYLIPRHEFRDACITVCINGYRVIGYPVSIYGKKYPRNEFIFNVAVVVDEEAEVVVWTGIIKRVAALLKEMEGVEGFLSEDESKAPTEMPPNAAVNDYIQPRGGSKVNALCEMILEDLNNYSECMIPLDPANTLNLKLFPLYPSPPKVAGYHVPLLTVDLSTLADRTWDLSMQRVTPHINGVNSVSKIASLSECEPQLVRRAIRHLVYYGCALVLDVFSYSASYAVTPVFGAFVADEEMQDECMRYVSVAVGVSVNRSPAGSSVVTDDRVSGSEADSSTTQESSRGVEVSEVKRDDLVGLYASLRQGVSLRLWCIENKEVLIGVDVRRLITFGIIRGFLYRVHKYAVATSSSNKAKQSRPSTKPHIEALRQRDSQGRSPRRGSLNAAASGNNLTQDYLEEHLARYLDGLHCFEEICSELHVPDKTMIFALKARGDVQVIQR